MLKLSARKLHTILFLNHFLLRKMIFGQLHLVIFLPPRVWAMNVGYCHHGMARPQVADGGTASYMEGNCE